MSSLLFPSLLRKAYNANRHMTESALNWSFQFSNLLRYFGFFHLWENQGTVNANTTRLALLRKIKNDFVMKVRHFFENEKAANGTFSSYIDINPTLSPNVVLNNIPNFHIRRYVSKLRVCDLPIETQSLRHRMKDVPKINRFCFSCATNVTGDEYHFIFKCEKLKNERLTFLSKYKDFTFRQLAGSDNISILMNLGRFVKHGIKTKFSKKQAKRS